jgi:hypothetical protein
MTAAQLHDARMLIPGAYELNAPPHRAARDPRGLPAAPAQDLHQFPSIAPTAHVVSAPAGPTTRLGHAATILEDMVLFVAIIYGVAVVPALAMWGVEAATAFVVDMFGRR